MINGKGCDGKGIPHIKAASDTTLQFGQESVINIHGNHASSFTDKCLGASPPYPLSRASDDRCPSLQSFHPRSP
jgi:hypothetical protein